MGHHTIEYAEPTAAPVVPLVNVSTFAEFAAIRENRGAGPSLSTWCPRITPVRGTGSFSVDYRSAAVGSITFHDANFGCAVHIDGDGILTGGHRRGYVLSIGIGVHRAHEVCAFVGERNLRAGHDGAGGIRDGADDGAAQCL